MINASNFVSFLKKNNILFFSGVPDSLLKNFNSQILKRINKQNHFICANEGTAISLAAGYNLETNKIPLVYLQNSGLGNLINPLTSLIDKNVYSIPMLILIGWRGAPKTNDEPQHRLMGEITPKILKLMKQNFYILKGNQKIDFFKLKQAIKIAKKQSAPYFLLVKRNIFNVQKKINISNKFKFKLSREEVLKTIIDNLDSKYKFISTTGKCSRELYELRKNHKKKYYDFYNVGAMGHVSQISLGASLFSKKKIVCLDGDGSLIMHMGGMSTIGNTKCKNLIHILLNNFCHDSVGGQPTSANTTNFTRVAKACGYKKIFGPIKSKKKLINCLNKLNKINGPIFIEIYINDESKKNLSRPDRNFINLKNKFKK